MKHRSTHFIHILSSFSSKLFPPFISFQTILVYFKKNDQVTSLSSLTVEQRPKGQAVSSRGLPEVQQREPGIPAGGPNTGAGGEARRGGEVRQRPKEGSEDKVQDDVRSRGKMGKVIKKGCGVGADCLGLTKGLRIKVCKWAEML